MGNMSLKLTMPTFVIRAWGYYRREGLRLFFKRIFQEIQGWNPFKREPLPPLQKGLVESNPEAIVGHVDLPVEGSLESSQLLFVAGWAGSKNGLEAIDLYLDNEAVKQIRTGLQRADVAVLHPEIPGAPRSGFSTKIRIDELQYGIHKLLLVVKDKAGNTRFFTRTFQRIENIKMYHSYYHSTLVSADELRSIKQQLSTTSPLPVIELWVTAAEENELTSTLHSIHNQDYPQWRCTIIAERASRQRIEEIVERVTVVGKRGRFRVLDAPGAPAAGPADANGYHGFLQAGETLAPHALYLYALQCRRPDADVIYSDHDLVQRGGLHVSPHFKPDWAPDYLLSRNYIGGFYLAKSTERLARLFEGSMDTKRPAWRFDWLLRLTEGAHRVAHIPRVLWSAPVKPQRLDRAYEHEREAVTQALARRGTPAAVLPGDVPGARRIQWRSNETPTVSIIIPTTGRMDHLRPCVASIREKTAYINYELIFIDNSRGKHPAGIAYLRSLGLKVIERDEPFNWAKLNNDGARASDADLLLFLNDDVEVVEEDWLTELVSQAIRPDIGAVGALLLYPNGAIQHAGVFLVAHGGGAIHFFHGLDPTKKIYLDLHRLSREVSANTGACLIVHRARFDEVGGFDENLAIVGNDVDLCLRLAQRGYRNIWTPYSRLIHHESVSRRDISIHRDEKKIWDRWENLLRNGDPYYNPNLAQDRPDCSLDWSKLKHIKEGAPAQDSFAGANLIGYIRAEMGVGEAARGVARAMKEAGVPFVILDYSYGNPARMGDDSWLHMTTDQPVYDINLLHVNADLTPQAFSRLPADFFANRYTIGIWYWELPEFPDQWLSSFSMLQEIWAPTAFIQEAVSRKSPVPVVRIPSSLRVPQGPFFDRKHFGLPETTYQFLMMYDLNSITERKNPKGAIHAFMNSFKCDDDSVALVIKINNADETELRKVTAMIDGYRNIHLIDKVLKRHEVDSLHACSDCFVSLHRSEGFGLPIAEAMSLGKPVIATYWSGNVDFMNTHNAACIDYELIELQKDYGPYKAGQHWADPDLEQASWWMKTLRGDPNAGSKLGAAAKASIAQQLNPLRIGNMIGERIKYIRLQQAS